MSYYALSCIYHSASMHVWLYCILSEKHKIYGTQNGSITQGWKIKCTGFSLNTLVICYTSQLTY